MSGVLSAVVGLVGVLVGAAVSYVLNARTRRRTFIEDQFNLAISAVAVAGASKNFLLSIVPSSRHGRRRWPMNSIDQRILSEQQYDDLLGEIAKAAMENHVKRAAEAVEAVARIAPYTHNGQMYKRLSRNPKLVVEAPSVIIRALEEAKKEQARTVRSRLMRLRRSD